MFGLSDTMFDAVLLRTFPKLSGKLLAEVFVSHANLFGDVWQCRKLRS